MSHELRHEDVFAYSPKTRARPVGEGIRRILLSHDQQVTLAKEWFEPGAAGGSDANTQSQISYVLDGFFEVDVDGKTQILGPGGSFFVPRGSRHSTVCREAGTLLNVVGAVRTAFPEQNHISNTRSGCD